MRNKNVRNNKIKKDYKIVNIITNNTTQHQINLILDRNEMYIT